MFVRLARARNTISRKVIDSAGLCRAAWAVAFLLMIVGSVIESDELARWGLFIGAVAVALTFERLARRIVTRMTTIVSLWEENVVGILPEHPLYDIPRQRAKPRRRRQRAVSS